jgi:hypothetical protein
LVASCPEAYAIGEHDGETCEINQAVLPVEYVRFDQEVFGYGAQIRLFAESLKKFDRRLFFVAAPEIFSSDESFRHFARLTGSKIIPEKIMHFRFGMHCEIRLLKRATNVLISAESHSWQALNPDAHPFADGMTVPASVALTLMLHPDQRPLQRIGGELCQSMSLGLSMKMETTINKRNSSVQILSLSNDGSERWKHIPLAALGAGRHVLVPWNVSFAGSVIPDLIGNIVRLQAGAGPELAITLLPYNATRATRPSVQSLARQIALNASSTRAYPVFIAKLHDFREAAGLCKSAHVVWLEAADPEFLWVHRCMASLGVATALINNAASRTGGNAKRHRFTIGADRSNVGPLERDGSNVTSGAAVTRGLSLQALRRLLRASYAA